LKYFQHEKDNYPGTGEEPRMKGELALREVDRRIVDRYLNAGPGSEAQFRIKWREVVEEMIRFRPDLVIISAGFDAHIDDPLGNCALRECDFEWGTDIVMEACLEIDSHSPPPVISVLEGGYNIQAIANSAAAHVASLAKVRSAPSAATGDEVSALAKHIESLNI
jgi:acetoin utilization deacetylase AcuC-like enzyme